MALGTITGMAKRDIPEDWDWRKLEPRRTKLGLSKTQVAAQCGVTAETVQGWETGAQRPRMPAFLKLLTALKWGFWDAMPDQ